MGDELSRIEFLESPEDAGDIGDIAWLDVDGEPAEDLDGSRGSSLLPPRTTARRVLLSLLIFALALSTTGFVGVHAFRHDQSVQAAENELVVREAEVTDPLMLTDPGELGGVGMWRLDPTASIAIGVTNESPDPITLLPDATLYGPGMTGPATLQPSGSTLLRPGQSDELTGVATVNCGIQTERLTSVLEDNTILVQARTASGAVGMATVSLDGGAESIRSEICTEEGDALSANFFPEAVNPAAHTFTVVVSARSLAAQSMQYQVTESYASSVASVGGPIGTEPGVGWVGAVGAVGSAAPVGSVGSGGSAVPVGSAVPGTSGAPVSSAAPVAPGAPVAGGQPDLLPGATATSGLPGVKLSAPVPTGAVDGTLAAGADLNAGFTIRVLSCPRSLPTAQSAVELAVQLNENGTPAVFQADGFNLDTLVGAACGLLA
jgi:hypothetical protein